ncbi:hypothetical protein H0O03_00520 [Candidatus Micrarchaeota archaeon]|nr:hypothetical protein [Candidatus Micrarchaeota archaeon]
MKCQRCGKEAHMVEPCDYCNRIACRSCIKSTRTVAKTIRRAICKDCWTKIPLRKKFKSEQDPKKVKKPFVERREY